jgi:hypothetical protein
LVPDNKGLIKAFVLFSIGLGQHEVKPNICHQQVSEVTQALSLGGLVGRGVGGIVKLNMVRVNEET